MYQIAKFFFN